MKIIEFLKSYIKDFLIAIVIIFISLITYEKPTYKIKEYSKKVNATSDSSVTDTDILNSEDENLETSKPLTIFKEEAPPHATTEIKIPTFEEVLFNEGDGKIKLVAITGTKSDKKALIIDHMNNLRIFKKGEKIDSNLKVIDITDTSIKFTFKNKTRELSLYRSSEITDRRPQSEISKEPVPDSTTLRQKPPQEDLILESENIENQRPDRFIKPRRENIR